METCYKQIFSACPHHSWVQDLFCSAIFASARRLTKPFCSLDFPCQTCVPVSHTSLQEACYTSFPSISEYIDPYQQTYLPLKTKLYRVHCCWRISWKQAGDMICLEKPASLRFPSRVVAALLALKSFYQSLSYLQLPQALFEVPYYACQIPDKWGRPQVCRTLIGYHETRVVDDIHRYLWVILLNSS